MCCPKISDFCELHIEIITDLCICYIIPIQINNTHCTHVNMHASFPLLLLLLTHTHTQAAAMSHLFNSHQHLLFSAGGVIVFAESPSSWVFHLSQTHSLLQREALLPTQRGYGDSRLPSLSLSGWSSGVWLRHRWSIVGVLTKIPPPPVPLHPSLLTIYPSPRPFLPRLLHGKMDLILQNPPLDREGTEGEMLTHTHTHTNLCVGRAGRATQIKHSYTIQHSRFSE